MAGDDAGGAGRATDGAERAADEAERPAGGAQSAAGGAEQAVDGTERATDEALKALAEPRRRAILRLVASDELAAGEIAAAFDVTRTAVSQHLTVLRNAGLLTERREGTRRLYRARPEGLAGLRRYLDGMWASSLEEARRLVEAEEGITDDEDHASRAG
jgi:DNA-binding transcriptional ArsR family regulator